MDDEKSNHRRKNIFKRLTLMKVNYLALLTLVLNHFTDELINIQTNFKNAALKNRRIKVVIELFDEDEKLKSWSVFTIEYNLKNTLYFQ